MAFQTGSATDVYDLLSQLRDFIATVGWTENAWNGTDTLQVSNGTSYWNLKAFDDLDANSNSISGGIGGDVSDPGIVLKGSTGFDAGLAWDNQPGDPGTDTALGAFSETDVPFYWFFSDGSSYVHVVAKIRAEGYTHLQLGDLVKIGTWTGGQYIAGTVLAANDNIIDAVSFCGNTENGSATIRADIDGLTDAWQNLGGQTARRLRGAFPRRADPSNLMGRLAAAAPNDHNGRSPMWPMLMLLDRTGNFDNWSIGGYPPDMRYLNIRFIDPEEVVVVGADEWLVFPHGHKNQNDFAGFAYKKVA